MLVMKTYTKTCGAAVIIAALCSCNGNQENVADEYFSDSCKIWPAENTQATDTLRAESVSAEIPGAYKLNVVDTILCVSTTISDALFEFCTLSGDSITTVGIRGNGPNDFTSNRTCGQVVNKNGEFGLWVIDVNGAKLKRLNISKSLSLNMSIVDEMVAIQPMVTDAFVCSEKLYQITCGEKNQNLKVSDTSEVNAEIFYDEKLYKIDFDSDKLFMAYNSSASIPPNGNYLALAMLSFNQINIIDLRDMTKSAVVIGEATKSDNIFSRDSLSPHWSYYTGITTSDNYIFALYENQIFDYDKDYVLKPCALHIVNYDGTIKAIVPLDRYIKSISYSQRDNKIYALSENDEICAYNLANIIH